MDVTIAGDAITYRPSDDNLGGLSLEFAAFDGEVGTGQAPVPDLAAAIDYYDGRQFKVSEGATLLTDGFIIDQDRERGTTPTDPARLHTFSVMDANALLDGFRVETTRPSETDYARVLWFAGEYGPDWDTTWVVNANLATLPAKTFASDGGFTSELIPDLVEFTGKTMFLHDLADGTGRCLHYHTLNSGHTCGLSISDQTSNGPTVWNPWEPRRQRTSVDLRNDIKIVDQTGRTSTVTDSTSITRHDADGLQHQALVNVEASSQADLDIKAAAMLASLKDERDTWTTTIGPLDADALALIRVGDLITVTSSVMGLSADIERIAHMTLRPWIGEGGRVVEGYWLAELELGAPVRRRARVRNAAFTDDVWQCVPTDFGLIWDPGSGGLGSCVIPEGELECQTDGAGGIGSDTVTLYAGTTYQVRYTVMHSSGSNALRAAIYTTTGPSTEYGGTEMGGRCPDSTTGGVYTIFAEATFSPADTQPYRAQLDGQFFVGCGSGGSSIEARIFYISGPDPRYEGLPACTNGAPRVGQRADETSTILGTDDGLGDGTTTDFTATYPFETGSLNIFCNGLDWTTDIASQTPGTGAFTMAYPFPTGSTVRIIYRRSA